METNYAQFLKSKKEQFTHRGFDVSLEDLNEMMRDDQKMIVQWMLKVGSAGCFAECGLGKTLMQMEWTRHCSAKTGKPGLIFTLPSIADQTADEEAGKFGFDVVRCWEMEDVDFSQSGIYITNYQRAHKFDLSKFGSVALDESDILANFTGKTKRYLIEHTRDVEYLSSWSATPSPNNHMEFGNHAEFLGVMKSNEMLSRWFCNDTMAAGNYRLKGHAVSDFWDWVSSWAVCLSLPSDLGFSDEGFELPELHLSEHVVECEAHFEFDANADDKKPNMSTTQMHKEWRRTAPKRAASVADLVNNSDEQWLVWCNTDYEADELKALIPDGVEVRGGGDQEKKSKEFQRFKNGEFRILITKPSIAGFGLNFQNCCNAAFVGLSYSFKDLYQALRRLYRFGQTKDVNAHIFIADTETSVKDNIDAKVARFDEMRFEMTKACCAAHELNRQELKLEWTHKVTTDDDWQVHLGDCVEVAKKLETDSFHYSIFSPPFSNLYIYSDYIQDMGNCLNHEVFFHQFKFLCDELLRIMKPGALVSVHCKDLPLYMNRDGAAGLYDFPGDCIKAMESAVFEDSRFVFHSRCTIWKCPVTEMTRTKNHGLLYKVNREDSRSSRQGMADYLITFRKWPLVEGYDKAGMEGNVDKYLEYDGPDKFVDGYMDQGAPMGSMQNPYDEDDTDHRYWSIQAWQRLASPVWPMLFNQDAPALEGNILTDIQQTDVLNIKQAKSDKDEKHICPLQLPLIRRAIRLWTQKGDTVFSPFTGIGSEGYGALELERKFVGIELKPEYYDIACENLASLSNSNDMFKGLD